MRAWRLLTVAAVGCGSTAPAESPRQRAPAAIAATIVRLGGCAPRRYRARAADRSPKRVARSPPPPPTLSIRPFASDTRNAALKTTVTRALSSVKNKLVACLLPVAPAGSLSATINLRFFRAGLAMVTLSSVQDAEAKKCAEDVIRAALRHQRPPSSIVYLTYHLRLHSPSRAPIETDLRREIDVLSSSDEPLSGLAIASAVHSARPALERCLSTQAVSGRGRVTAALEALSGEIRSAQISGAGSSLSDCWASALAGIEIAPAPRSPLASRSKLDGEYECALAFGPAGTVSSPIVLTLSAAGLATSAGGNVVVDPSKRPPRSRLYEHLLEVRFSTEPGLPSPAPATLLVEPDVVGSAIIAVLDAARAADIEVTGVAVGPRARAVPRVPRPQLGELAGRAATATIIIDERELWIGLGADVAASLIALDGGVADGLGRRLDEIRAIDGARHRNDAVVGIGGGAQASNLALVLEALSRREFDQIVFVDAEKARARLAR